MAIRADARCLPFADGSFDLILTSPPWENPAVLMDARRELTRVLTARGEMVLILPHLDNPHLASLVVVNRDWTMRSSFAIDKPVEDHGLRYHSLSDALVARILRRACRHRVLDPYCGSGTVARVARSMGLFSVGCDIDPWAVRLAATA